MVIHSSSIDLLSPVGEFFFFLDESLGQAIEMSRGERKRIRGQGERGIQGSVSPGAPMNREAPINRGRLI